MSKNFLNLIYNDQLLENKIVLKQYIESLNKVFEAKLNWEWLIFLSSKWVELYDKNWNKLINYEKLVNDKLKEIKIEDNYLIWLLDSYQVNIKSVNIENKKSMSLENNSLDTLKNSVLLLKTADSLSNFSIYYDYDTKTIIFDKWNIYKEYMSSKKEEVKREAKIVLSDDLNFNDLESVENIFNENANWHRTLFHTLPPFIEFCLTNDIWDIVYTEDDFPYFVKWESIITKDTLLEKINKVIFKDKPISKEEIIDFIWSLDENSKSENILANLEEDFKTGGKWFVDFAILINWVKLRVNTAYLAWKKISIVMRVIKSWKPPKMEDLWLVEDWNNAYRSVLTQPFGLILIVWPTWSWKSYSLTSMLWEINNTQNKRIITLEDPVEFEHINVKSKFEQREIWVDVATYLYWLKSALRQKPHIIVCWEIRDVEVMELALEAASTWHVVFATLHANDVIQTVQRIVQMFPIEKQNNILQQLSEMLLWVFVQKLVPRKWGWKVLIKEIMIKNSSVARAIYDNDMKMLLNAIEQGWDLWMITNDEAILKLFREDKITDKTAYEYAKNKTYVWSNTWYDKYAD